MSFGGSETSEVKIPEWVVDPSKRAIARGEDAAALGYMPWMGPDVAAFTPTQEAAFNNNIGAAQAFGMAAPSQPSMPQAQDYGGGMSGYSGYGMYDNIRNQYATANPGQAELYNSFFVNPQTGAMPVQYQQTGAGTAGAAAPQAFVPDFGGRGDHGVGTMSRGIDPGQRGGVGDFFGGIGDFFGGLL
jgi:hypothetical protein